MPDSPNPIADPLVEGADASPTAERVRLTATVQGAVTLELNRPDRRNAFNPDLISALTDRLETLHGAEGVRVVFLKGAGGAFCAGADLDWMKSALSRSEADNREESVAFGRMFRLLWELPQLTVALVDGPAFGGGAGLVCCCDMAVATTQARFSFSEVRIGLLPALISPYMVRALGPRAARALAATGRTFDAAYAEKIGLVSEVVPDAAGLGAAARRIAAEMIACAPGAVADAKRMATEVYGKPIDNHLLDETARRIAAARQTPEGQEGIAAFFERRKPAWAARD